MSHTDLLALMRRAHALTPAEADPVRETVAIGLASLAQYPWSQLSECQHDQWRMVAAEMITFIRETS